MDMQVVNETEGDKRANQKLVRVVVAGATGFAGQELIRLLARHPHVTITAATGSQATSAPRRLPALTKIWDGTVVPLNPGAFEADAVFLAIVRTADQRHIGNLRIGAIDRHHHTATIALVIGDKSAWGHGLGSEAIALATAHAFSALGLRKLNARCYATNLGSIRAFEKAGWKHEGRQGSQFETAAGRVDGVWLGIERA